MAKQDPNVMYYSNQDGEAARIARELVTELFIRLKDELSSEAAIEYLRYARLQKERELYGAFIKSLVLIAPKLKGEIDYVATELQITRSESDAKGRVDFLFNYRKTSFLVELKVARVGVNGKTSAEHEEGGADPIKCIIKPWDGVVSQLNGLDKYSIETCLHKKVVKLPMVIYMHVDWCKQKPSVDVAEAGDLVGVVAQSHSKIVAEISKQGDAPEFQFYSPLSEPVRTRMRKSSLADAPNMTLYGFSFIASTL